MEGKAEIKDKMEQGRDQNGCKGFFPKLLKKEAHCCLEQKGEVTHPELLGKKEGEAEDLWKKSFQAQCLRDYWSSLLSSPGRSCQRDHWKHWKQGLISSLAPRKLRRKQERSDCLFALNMAGGIQDLATIEASGLFRKSHLQTLGDTRECPSQSILIA
jgi:hypothetical protein